MVQVIIHVNKDKLQNISEQIPKVKKRGLQLTSQGMMAELKKTSPVKHGLLRSWFYSKITDDEVDIQTPAKYAKYVNDGTGIYGPYHTPIIHPSIGKHFVFEAGGQIIFTRMIRGQKGQHFVERSIEATKQRLGNYFRIAVSEVFK